tara:strand:- start:628 stop:831 length:204 start_codon:yes stop_codon:yes gene_type:complete
MELAVKLNQSFESLYNLDFLEYSMILSILKRKIEESNSDSTSTSSSGVYFDTTNPVKLDIPSDIKLR